MKDVKSHPEVLMLAAEAASQRTSMSHTEKCQRVFTHLFGQAFFSRIVCAVVGGMTGSAKDVRTVFLLWRVCVAIGGMTGGDKTDGFKKQKFPKI